MYLVDDPPKIAGRYTERNYNGEKILVAINSSEEEKEVYIGKNHSDVENLLTGEKMYCDGKILVAGNGIFVGKVI